MFIPVKFPVDIARNLSVIFAVGGKNVLGSVILKSFLMLAYFEEYCCYFGEIKTRRNY